MMLSMSTAKDVVVITGGNAGLGIEIVKSLCKSTVKPYEIYMGSRSLLKAQDAIDEVEKEVGVVQSTVTAVQIDVTDDKSIEAAFKTIEAKAGRVDVLINNAGVSLDMDVQAGKKTMREAWNEMYNVNVTGTQIMTHTFVPLLLKSPSPRVVFITSGTSSIEDASNGKPFTATKLPAGWPKPAMWTFTGYRTSKAALNMQYCEWGRILKEDNIKMWAISPGFLATGLAGQGREKLLAMGAREPSFGSEMSTETKVATPSIPTLPLTSASLALLSPPSSTGDNTNANNKRARSTSISACSSLTSLSTVTGAESDLSELSDDGDDSSKSKRGETGLPTPSPSDASKRRKGAPRRANGKEPVEDDKQYLTEGLYYDAEVAALKGGENAPARVAAAAVAKGKGKARDSTGGEDDYEVLGWINSIGNTLPEPIHHGDALLTREREFRLPFDIARDFAIHERVGIVVVETKKRREKKEVIKKVREISRKPNPYRRIPRNVYVERKPDKADIPAICHCKIPEDGSMGCGDGCLNRMLQFSCSPKHCPLGDKCSNKPLHMQAGVSEGKTGLKVIWTGSRGFGLKTMVDIKAGDFVIEYRGEVISRNESYRRVLNEYKDTKAFYFLDYDGDEVIDAGLRGTGARFINHSCGPNLQVVRWRLADVEEYEMGIFALHDIPADTELTYDYGWQDYSTIVKPGLPVEGTAADASTAVAEPYRQRCFCGADACSGYLGMKKEKEKKEKVDKTATKGQGKKRRVEKAKLALNVKVKVSAAKVVGKKPTSGKRTVVSKKKVVVKAKSKDKGRGFT
ncbi:hypothetical protein MNV49_005784 [Pseudohyphozyma bogoriensis]|nr:hypothetical protein MNV49_005784 [Pseudohyphozyma bogoriensis]